MRLRHFLDRNGFFARQSDIEAIMRRFDHNANQCIDFNEFYEITTGNEHVIEKKGEAETPDVMNYKQSPSSRPMRGPPKQPEAANFGEAAHVTID
jgi:hypothetical protein